MGPLYVGFMPAKNLKNTEEESLAKFLSVQRSITMYK